MFVDFDAPEKLYVKSAFYVATWVMADSNSNMVTTHNSTQVSAAVIADISDHWRSRLF